MSDNLYFGDCSLCKEDGPLICRNKETKIDVCVSCAASISFALYRAMGGEAVLHLMDKMEHKEGVPIIMARIPENDNGTIH